VLTPSLLIQPQVVTFNIRKLLYWPAKELGKCLGRKRVPLFVFPWRKPYEPKPVVAGVHRPWRTFRLKSGWPSRFPSHRCQKPFGRNTQSRSYGRGLSNKLFTIGAFSSAGKK